MTETPQAWYDRAMTAIGSALRAVLAATPTPAPAQTVTVAPAPNVTVGPGGGVTLSTAGQAYAGGGAASMYDPQPPAEEEPAQPVDVTGLSAADAEAAAGKPTDPNIQ